MNAPGDAGFKFATAPRPAMDAERPTQIMLVDDHPVVRSGYARLIEQAQDMHVLAEAGSTEEAIGLLRAGAAPDVVVTDLSMPGGADGIALIGHVRSQLPDCQVIVFSMYDSPGLIRRALQAGAAGFLSKSSAPQRMVQAIRSVRAGSTVVTPGLRESMAARPDADDRARIATLTEREFDLFRLLAEGRSIVECARQLHLSPKTASNYQTLVREKLGVSTSAAMAHLAMRCGVIEVPLAP